MLEYSIYYLSIHMSFSLLMLILITWSIIRMKRLTTPILHRRLLCGIMPRYTTLSRLSSQTKHAGHGHCQVKLSREWCGGNISALQTPVKYIEWDLRSSNCVTVAESIQIVNQMIDHKLTAIELYQSYQDAGGNTPLKPTRDIFFWIGEACFAYSFSC